MIKPTHQAVHAYYDTLAVYAARGAAHEGATQAAFGRLRDVRAKGGAE